MTANVYAVGLKASRIVVVGAYRQLQITVASGTVGKRCSGESFNDN